MKFGKSKASKVKITGAPRDAKYSQVGKHPVMIAYTFNGEMKCYDIILQVGNFQTEADAKQGAAHLREFAEENLAMKMQRPS